jgi:hypothetical protein
VNKDYYCTKECISRPRGNSGCALREQQIWITKTQTKKRGKRCAYASDDNNSNNQGKGDVKVEGDTPHC